MTKWHARYAWVGEVASDVLIEAEGDRIASVTSEVTAPADATRLEGFAIPGLVNAHSHAFHRALRGRTHEAGGDFWSWRDLMYHVAERLDPDSYLDLATAVYAEMALAGITCVGEFHYLHHRRDGSAYSDPNAMGTALIEAASRAGIRITLLDACYLQAGLRGEPLQGPQIRFCDGDAERWAERVGKLQDGSAAKIAGAIHSVRAVDPESMSVVADWARDAERPIHMHMSEQRSENETCMEATGMSPAELASDRGVVGPGTTVVHATHVTPLDIELLGRSHTSVCMCPTTERDLGDGIGPASVLRDAGCSLSLGTDSHAIVDMFEEARAMELDERLASKRRGLHRPNDLLIAATAGGARSLGWDAGRIEPGALADLVVLDTSSVRMAGSDRDHLAAHTVFAATAADVRGVIVGGRTIVADGRHLSLPDVPRRLGDAIRTVVS